MSKKSVKVEIKDKNGLEIFTQNISANDIFTLDGFDKKGTLGTKIFIYIDGKLNTQIHTSCSVPILIGMEFGDFVIRDGSSRNGGEICSVDGYASNTAPEAISEALSSLEDETLDITLNATDIDNQPLVYTILTQPTHGVLSGTAPQLIYTPNANYYGADSFTFVANDGSLDSLEATISISVLSVNDAPVAVDDNISLGLKYK